MSHEAFELGTGWRWYIFRLCSGAWARLHAVILTTGLGEFALICLRIALESIRVAEPKEIILSILGTSVGLAGLFLVFVGFLYSRAMAYPPGTDKAIVNKFVRASKWGMLPFSISICVAVTSQLWLAHPIHFFYLVSFWGALITVVSVMVYGLVTVFKLF